MPFNNQLVIKNHQLKYIQMYTNEHINGHNMTMINLNKHRYIACVWLL